ncbi:uncharacterized protein LOC110020025 [Phalaenopsis equestris]|uniref:uncharacterized protein LOC110020025 n=1 Tax=Phalaenopsis equestris TaxID=78828 RepID=UPI0009E43F56|nr:uncharacterized protein LOC110020025 [Phalaenopsis equestris]
MDHTSLTLTLTLIFLTLFLLIDSLSLSSPIHSLTPASSPSHPPLNHIMSEPSGVAALSPPHQKHSPKPVFHHHQRQPPPHPSPGKLNFGKKLGFAFIAIAGVLQVTFAGFLIYKRQQLKKIGRNYRMRVSS